MAITAEELRILVRAETKQAQSELNRFRKTSKNTTMDLKNLAKSLIGPLSVAAGVTLLTKAASSFVKEGVRFNMQLEQLSVSFETILGSAGAAADMMKQLADFSASTPLQLANLASGATRLIAFGTAAEDVVDTMRNLGNAAMGNQAVLDRLVLAYGKVQAKGKASLEEINMFTEAGVPLMAELAKNLGLTNAELFKFISAGKVGFEEVDKALKSLTTGQGQFAGLLEKQSKTLAGSTSTLKDTFALLRAEITVGLTPGLTNMNTKLTEVFNSIRSNIAATNAYKRVLNQATVEVRELSTAEELAFQQRNIRDLKTIRSELLREIAIESGDLGGARKAWKDFYDVMADNGFVTTIGLNKELDILNRSIDGAVRRTGELKTTLAGGIADVPIPGLVDPLGGASGTTAGNAFGKSFFSELVGMAGDARFFFEQPAEDGGEETGRIFADHFGETVSSMIGPEFDIFAHIPAFDAGKDAAKQFAEGFNFKEVQGLMHVRGGPEIVFSPFIDAVKEGKTHVDNLKMSIQDLAGQSGNMAALVAATEAYKAKLKDLNDTIEAIGESFKKNIIDLMGNATLSLLRDMGQATTEMGEGAMTAADAWGSFAQAINNAMPQILLAVGTALIQTGDPTMIGIGLAAILASGLWSFFGGRNQGNRNNASNTAGAIPSPARGANTFAGSQVYIDVNGDVLLKDLREAEAIGANAAAKGHR